MLARILTVLTGLVCLCSTQTVSHAEMLRSLDAASPIDSPAHALPVALTPANTTIVGVVPASAFPSCENAVGGVLYITRVQHTPAVVSNEEGAEGPACATSSAETPDASAGTALLVVPMTKDGTLSDQPCKVIATPQHYCEIPAGSILSAFPLA